VAGGGRAAEVTLACERCQVLELAHDHSLKIAIMIDSVYHEVARLTLTCAPRAAILSSSIISSKGAVRMSRSKGRLTTPLVRDGGELRPAGWDVALDRAAAGFARARATDTSTSFGIFSCSKASNEMNFLAQKFARQVMRTNNIDSCNRT
jgi:formate dehydrogenase major subunit